MYAVGIDIGTTYTAAAVWRDGRAEIVPLGSHSAAIPSAVFLRSDGTFLTGESAYRRGLSEPGRVVRQVKRRLGDTTPILLGGTPYSAAALTARMLRSVVEAVSSREGGPPSSICITHPASWGPYQVDLLHQVVRLADVEQPVRFTTEAQAAAMFHGHQQRLGPGAVVAVYDLGGGTFDAAVLRKTSDGFDLTGEPEEIQGLGGADFDAKIFAHVAAKVGDALGQPGKDDSVAIAATARLREECVQAKEALSTDTDAVIQVLLPGVSTEVRLTRSELEEMVGPALRESVEALQRTIRSAGYAPTALDSVLLAGGSSRMPIVARLVGAELGRPVAADANPKHAVALGAAWQASTAIAGTGPAPAGASARDAAKPTPVDPGPTPGSDEPTGEIPILGLSAGKAPEPGPTKAAATGGTARKALFAGRATVGKPRAEKAETPKPTKTRIPILAAAAAAVLLLTAGGTAWALTRPSSRSDTTVRAASDPRPSGAAAIGPAAASSQAVAGGVPAYEKCTDEMKKSTRWVCLTKATLHDNTFTVWYDAEWDGTPPDIKTGFHLHIYGGDGIHPDEATMGSQAVIHSKYYFEDQEPSVRRTADDDFKAIGNAEVVCARIAHSGHGLVKAYDGSYHTGNCIPIDRY